MNLIDLAKKNLGSGGHEMELQLDVDIECRHCHIEMMACKFNTKLARVPIVWQYFDMYSLWDGG